MFIKMHEDVVVPKYETFGSSGMDIRFWEKFREEVRFYRGNVMVFGTGVRVALQEGFELQVRPRSGLAFKHGITVLNAPGTIDSDYTHEIKVCLINQGASAVTMKKGDRIAQLVYAPVVQMPGATVSAVERNGGFGSTGRG